MFVPRPEPMQMEQRAHVDALAQLWLVHGELLVECNEPSGGIQWKTVSGADDLMRRRPRKLQGGEVLGKRSPETEVLHEGNLRRREP